MTKKKPNSEIKLYTDERYKMYNFDYMSRNDLQEEIVCYILNNEEIVKKDAKELSEKYNHAALDLALKENERLAEKLEESRNKINELKIVKFKEEELNLEKCFDFISNYINNNFVDYTYHRSCLPGVSYERREKDILNEFLCKLFKFKVKKEDKSESRIAHKIISDKGYSLINKLKELKAEINKETSK